MTPRVREVSPAEAAAALSASSRRPILVDCREPREWQAVRIPGSTLIPLDRLADEAGSRLPDRSTPVFVHCAVGVRSLLAIRLLASLGYEDVASVAGGIEAWESAGLPVEVGPPGDGRGPTPAVLSPEERARYSRHLLMPEIGPEGQARLLASRVLVVGAGGLGSPVLLYLAAAGVGTLGIADFDTVDLSNLQRQVVHAADRVGRPKTESARLAVAALNPAVRIVTHEGAVTAANAAALVEAYDLVVDGTDSFDARYALNDAAVAGRIPLVHASVYRFEGQVTVFAPGGPCYRCLYPEALPPELAPACSAVGVLGVVPGIVGLLQANEALKLLLGIGEPLVGRLLLFDALDSTTSEVRIRRDPACPVCLPGPTDARTAIATGR